METQSNAEEKIATPIARRDTWRNGVNLTWMAQTIRAIQGDPALADFQFRAKNKWHHGGLNEFSSQNFYGAGQEHIRKAPFKTKADEPPVLLGTDQGANPVEILLGALSACMTTTLVYLGAAQGIEIQAVESSYEGDLDMHGFLQLDPKVRPGYQEVRVNFKVKSNADAEKVKELVRASPVYDMLTRPVPIKINVVTE